LMGVMGGTNAMKIVRVGELDHIIHHKKLVD
jgi:hypothetical protein